MNGYESQIQHILTQTDKFIEDYCKMDPAMNNMTSLVMTDASNINEDLVRNSARYAYIGVLTRRAAEEEAQAHHFYKQEQARIGLGFRTGKITTDVKLTEGSISDLVITHQDVVGAHLLYIEKKRIADSMADILRAIAQKNDLIEVLSNNMRKEMKIQGGQ
jgi:hypothetical protein